MNLPQYFPKLKEGQLAILAVEGLTGIVLSVEGRRAIADEDRYRVCHSLDEARNLAIRLVEENPQWECVIYDNNAKRLELHRDEDALVHAARSGATPTWWSRIWK